MTAGAWGPHYLPDHHDIRLMKTWVRCPVHGGKIGIATDGTVVGRCALCMVEASRAIATIRRGEA